MNRQGFTTLSTKTVTPIIDVLLTAIDLHGAEELIKGFIISYNKDSRDYGGDWVRGTKKTRKTRKKN
jgi:hypothetical protein